MYKKINFGIIVPLLLLLFIGWLLVFSSSAYFALANYDDPYFFISRHTKFIIIGIFAMILTSLINYKMGQNKTILLIMSITSFMLMFLTQLIGVEVNGSKRWLELFGLQFMPVDLAKVAIIFVMSYTLSTIKVTKSKFIAIGIHMGFPLLIMIFTFLQPDFSSMIILFGLSASMLFIGYEHTFNVMVIGALSIGLLFPMGWIAPYRMERITGFIAGLKDINNALWQIRYGIYAIATGGFFGVGAGKSTFNKLWIPEPHNDMILATLGEEFGFFGILVVTILYFILVINIMRLATKSKDQFTRYISFGIAMTIFLQIFVNYGNTLGLLPPTGIPLPFISFGGTNVIILLALIGVSLSISRINWSK